MKINIDLDFMNFERILRECGEMLMKISSIDKADGKWVGEQYKARADSLAHKFLVQELSRFFAGKPVVSEEDDNLLEINSDYIIVDPIDGTASFSNGFSGWVTQAAYISNNIPIFSGIYAPTTKEYFSAIKGRGAFFNGSQISCHSSKTHPTSIIDNYPKPRGIAHKAMLGLKIPNYIESGSISLKICRVATGSADLFLKDMQPRDWDLAAPMLLLEEAGGVLTNLRGEPIQLGSRDRCHSGLVACRNKAMLDFVLSWLT